MSVALSGLFVGILFGFALQRGRFCMNSAIRDTILLKDTTLLKSVIMAILVAMVGFALLASAGLIKISPSGFFWGAHLVGGILFGIGMVLAGGCASGITYRIGEGVASALSAAIGLTIAGTLTMIGFLTPIKDYLQKSTQIWVTAANEAEPVKFNPTLANIFGMDHTLVAIGLAVIIAIIWIVIAIKNREEPEKKTKVSLFTAIFSKGWVWWVTGIVIGLVNVLAFYMSTLAKRSYPLGITSGWAGIAKVLIGYEQVTDGVATAYKLGWGDYLIIGIILGTFIAALIAREFKIRWPGWGTIGQTFAGGLLMGFGAITSGGCNVGHILSGLPQLGIGSIVGSISIVLGAWLMAYLIFVRPQTA
jgi:uncharacterized membrane protein YedE/YeeE